MVEHDLRCSSKHICCSTHLTPPPPPPPATHNPPSTFNTKNPYPQRAKPMTNQAKPKPTTSKPRPTASKPTTNQQRANNEQIENHQPRSQPSTQDLHTETQIANWKSPTQLPPKLASHHYWNPNRNPLTKISTHRPKS